MKPFDWQFPYPSQRMPILARNCVATSQPLAAQAGLRMLMKGGSAVDAVLATAISLTVLEPTSNGIGSDAFAILWDGRKLQGLNASGRSPAAWTPARFKGLDAMPQRGWDAVTVPSAVAAWVELSAKYGKLPFADLFEPAIGYASRGFMVSPTISRLWQKQLPELKGIAGYRMPSCRTAVLHSPARLSCFRIKRAPCSESRKPKAKLSIKEISRKKSSHTRKNSAER